MVHTILSYEFEDGRRLACSIEVRRKKGSRYHPLKGIFRAYELIYVWGTERDIIGGDLDAEESRKHIYSKG